MSSLGLLPGEELDPEEVTADVSAVPWSIGELRIITETTRWTVKVVNQIFAGKDYELSPEYQRRRRWDDARKSRLIESLILNVPVPPIFLYETSEAEYEVMDGQQRLSTILDYYADSFSLVGLTLLKDLNGRKRSELTAEASRQLDRSIISAIVLLAESTRDPAQQKRMKELVFERINTGGVKLADQEIRNALMRGGMNSLCNEMSKNGDYRSCWGWTNDLTLLDSPPGQVPETDDDDDDDAGSVAKTAPGTEETRSMKDVEYVLRFFALRQRSSFSSTSLRAFLDLYQERGNKFGAETLTGLQNLFEETFALINEVLGENAFRRWRNEQWGKKSSPVMYDAVSQAFGRHVGNAAAIRANKAAVEAGIKAALEQHENEFKASYGSWTYVARRIDWISDAISGALP